MIPRPKNTDTMEDVLKMQNDYLKKLQEEKIQPAAQAIIINKGTKRQSLFAKQRNLKKSSEKPTSSGKDVVTKEVIERKYTPMDVDELENLFLNQDEDEDAGFPKPMTISADQEISDMPPGKSLFSRMMASSTTIKEDDLKRGIHEENSQTLNAMSLEEIRDERDKLLKSMDPKLIEYLRSKGKKEVIDHVKMEESSSVKEEEAPRSFDEMPDILKEENAKNWLNMDIFEPEKLEWTRDINKINKILKPGETYEARFDWKGFLLPYVDNENETKDDRELYLHGDESHRPGYTLQELFHLARSIVLQQRVSAISAISGILNIYNQGYYDGILELPISKIFFFLRFALDENTPVIIEASAKALSYLFYNETDETMLDILFETKNGFIQPLMDNSMVNEKVSDLEDFNDITAKVKLFESTADDFIDADEHEKESVNDFHLAEVNLVECLMRTNIIERISYILITTSPNEKCLHSCIKILIRIARSGHEFAVRINNKRNLVECLIRQYLPVIDNKQEPCYLIFKLFRILASYDVSINENLKSLGAIEKAKSYICSQNDVNVNLLKLQIESFRFLRLYYLTTDDDDSFNELFMALRYFLEWHYQNLDFQQANHFIIRTHASALLYLISCSKIHISFSIYAEVFKMCCSKWFHMANRYGVIEFSQKMLLSTVLDVANVFMSFSPEYFYEFIDYLMKFLTSSHFQGMQENLNSSPLFKNINDRCNVHRPLINVGSIVRRNSNSAPTLVFTQDYSAILMDSILTFIECLRNNNNNAKNPEYHQKLIQVFSSAHIENYLRDFSSLNRRPAMAANWFMKTEIKMILKMLMHHPKSQNALKLAFNLIHCLTCENFLFILVIFKEFLFNHQLYGDQIAAEELDRFNFIFNGIVDSKISGKDQIKKHPAVAEKWNQILLDKTWTYSLLLVLFYNVEVNPDLNRVMETELSEKEIILTTLKFNDLVLKNGIQFITADQELMYLMLIYFGKELNFLDDDVKVFIAERLKVLTNSQFKLNQKLNNEKSFENLFTMFLDYFQANSYGDNLFSTFVMIPLAQKYDVKWRKVVWSEYAMVLKFITCDQTNLNFDEYLQPVETDVSLLKCYMTALSSHWLRKDSLPWKIANHHVKNSRHLLIKSDNQ